MWKIIFISMICIILFAIIVYPIQLYIKMKINKKKIMIVVNKIYEQVDFKHSLLKEYLEINKDTMEEEKYIEIENELNNYGDRFSKDIVKIKNQNELYCKYMSSFDDGLLNRTCLASEKEIKKEKEKYNNLVNIYNKYKENKINSFLFKVMSIREEKIF